MATGRPQNRGHKQKPRQPQLKHDCGCGLFIYLPWKQTRLASEAGGHICGECGGRFIPANFEDCKEFAPALAHLHSEYVEDDSIAHLDDWADCEGHCECGWRRANGTPDYFYCHKCRKVNERHLDGSMGSFSAGPFSPEAEKAFGLTVKHVSAAAVVRLTEPDTYAVQPDVPF